LPKLAHELNGAVHPAAADVVLVVIRKDFRSNEAGRTTLKEIWRLAPI
jgi:hypothetical protein